MSQASAAEDTGASLDHICEELLNTVGGELNAEAMSRLNADQITLLAYQILRHEVMEGGFIQLIHNGYGPFIFHNPFAKAIRLWGEEAEADTGTAILHDFSKLIYKGRKLFDQEGEALTRPCTDEEFMALYEQFPEFEELDDFFVTNEEEWTSDIAQYVDNHIDNFATITT
jgi:hypothetical protein